MKGRLKVLAAAAAGGLAVYFFLTFFASRVFIPEEFSEARIKGAQLAKNIVELSQGSLKSLEEIESLDKAGKRSAALILISKEVIKNREAYQEAIHLSSQLEHMARNLSDIKPSSARILATEAISSEVALVSRLISYNDYLLQLFQALQSKFQGELVNANGKVKELINKVNEEALAINEFNRRFSQSLAEFDKLIK